MPIFSWCFLYLRLWKLPLLTESEPDLLSHPEFCSSLDALAVPTCSSSWTVDSLLGWALSDFQNWENCASTWVMTWLCGMKFEGWGQASLCSPVKQRVLSSCIWTHTSYSDSDLLWQFICPKVSNLVWQAGLAQRKMGGVEGCVCILYNLSCHWFRLSHHTGQLGAP